MSSPRSFSRLGSSSRGGDPVDCSPPFVTSIDDLDFVVRGLLDKKGMRLGPNNFCLLPPPEHIDLFFGLRNSTHRELVPVELIRLRQIRDRSGEKDGDKWFSKWCFILYNYCGQKHATWSFTDFWTIYGSGKRFHDANQFKTFLNENRAKTACRQTKKPNAPSFLFIKLRQNAPSEKFDLLKADVEDFTGIVHADDDFVMIPTDRLSWIKHYCQRGIRRGMTIDLWELLPPGQPVVHKLTAAKSSSKKVSKASVVEVGTSAAKDDEEEEEFATHSQELDAEEQRETSDVESEQNEDEDNADDSDDCGTTEKATSSRISSNKSIRVSGKSVPAYAMDQDSGKTSPEEDDSSSGDDADDDLSSCDSDSDANERAEELAEALTNDILGPKSAVASNESSSGLASNDTDMVVENTRPDMLLSSPPSPLGKRPLNFDDMQSDPPAKVQNTATEAKSPESSPDILHSSRTLASSLSLTADWGLSALEVPTPLANSICGLPATTVVNINATAEATSNVTTSTEVESQSSSMILEEKSDASCPAPESNSSPTVVDPVVQPAESQVDLELSTTTSSSCPTPVCTTNFTVVAVDHSSTSITTATPSQSSSSSVDQLQVHAAPALSTDNLAITTATSVSAMESTSTPTPTPAPGPASSQPFVGPPFLSRATILSHYNHIPDLNVFFEVSVPGYFGYSCWTPFAILGSDPTVCIGFYPSSGEPTFLNLRLIRISFPQPTTYEVRCFDMSYAQLDTDYVFSMFQADLERRFNDLYNLRHNNFDSFGNSIVAPAVPGPEVLTSYIGQSLQSTAGSLQSLYSRISPPVKPPQPDGTNAPSISLNALLSDPFMKQEKVKTIIGYLLAGVVILKSPQHERFVSAAQRDDVIAAFRGVVEHMDTLDTMLRNVFPWINQVPIPYASSASTSSTASKPKRPATPDEQRMRANMTSFSVTTAAPLPVSVSSHSVTRDQPLPAALQL